MKHRHQLEMRPLFANDTMIKMQMRMRAGIQALCKATRSVASLVAASRDRLIN